MKLLLIGFQKGQLSLSTVGNSLVVTVGYPAIKIIKQVPKQVLKELQVILELFIKKNQTVNIYSLERIRE